MFTQKNITRILILLLVLVSLSQNVFADNAQPQKSTFKKVDSKLVCMVNDKFMGIDQIPVKADGKVYYGCCENCVVKLQENQKDIRFAIDPFSLERVDKADAYIVTLGDKSHKVLYFKSESHYQNYLKKIGSEK